MKRTNGWIDIHCHCLPGVDDGSKNIEQSMEMLKTAYQQGIRAIIATPHYHYRRGKTSVEELRNGLFQLRKKAAEYFPDLAIYPGNEVYYDSTACEALREGRVLTLCESSYVLVEFRPETEYQQIRNAVYELQTEGYWPIIAHVERYECVVKDMDKAFELSEMGAYLQVNASSVAGKNGWTTGRFVKKLFKAGLVTFVATDAHDDDRRAPVLEECIRVLEKKYGEAVAEQCLVQNPQKILQKKAI